MAALEPQGYGDDVKKIVPKRIAHFVIRTNKYREMISWYLTVFQGEIVTSNDQLTFIAFDDEHHRLAIANSPELEDITQNSTAIDHVAFTYSSLDDLLATYQRLDEIGIKPAHTLNHGPTTSFYYVDPNENMIELQVDNFPTLKECQNYFKSDAFAANPIGVPVDPNQLIASRRDRKPVFELLRPV